MAWGDQDQISPLLAPLAFVAASSLSPPHFLPYGHAVPRAKAASVADDVSLWHQVLAPSPDGHEGRQRRVEVRRRTVTLALTLAALC